GGGGTGYTSSGTDGTYLIDTLTSGNYRVYAQAPGYERQFYNGAPDEASATLVATSSGGETPGIDFVLLEGGKISGTITNALGTPIAGAYVTAERDGGSGYGGAFTGFDGTYLIDSLSAGQYRVGASASGYLTTYYDGELLPWFATLVGVSTGAETSGINIALQEGGRISGTVTDLLGTPIAGAGVYAERVTGYAAAYVVSAADGTYLADQLPPGDYKVSASAAGHLAQYYDGADDWNAATLVAVSSGSETTGIDFALPEGAKISGTVADALGTPIAGAFVVAERAGSLGGSGYAWSGADGMYLIDTLGSGNYRVRASASGYPTQYYDGVYDSGAATLVSASLGVETAGIDFALLEGGKISGAITNALGTPIPGAYVSASQDGGPGYGGAYTAADGTYLINALIDGNYRVHASASGYPSQFYDGASEWSLATLVSVSSGVETTGIDFAMVEGAKISGTVRDALGTPIAGAYISVERDGGYGYGSTYAGADGAYLIDTLPAGNYRVYALATDYPGQYYDGTYDWSAATLVSASPGIETAGIDFALSIGGRISGTVTDVLGTPIAGAWVSASLDVCCSGNSAITAPDGTYTIRGLRPGDYRVSSFTYGYVEQYYSGTRDWSAATLVATSSGSETTGIDFTLEESGNLSGIVTDVFGAPIGDAWVYATDVGGAGGGSIYTASDGTYLLPNLPPGTYRVEAQKAGFAWQFYDGTSDASAATPVNVTSGAETSGIDFALVVGARISGKVTNSLGTPISGAWVAAAQDGGFGGGSYATGSDGVYTIDTLVTGNYQVSAWAYGYGTQYWDHVEDAGSATLVPATSGVTTPNIDFSLQPPDPDHSWTPKDILAFPFTDSRNTAAASLEPGEQQPCGDVGATIWYRLVVPYSPPGTTTVTVDTAGSDFDTAVAVYTPDYSLPSPPGGLALIGCNATGLRSWQTFAADPGSVYYVQVGGQSGATGNLVVNAGADTDGDGLRDDAETNTGVYVAPTDAGSNPALVDTDGDACGDGQEVLRYFLNPVNQWDFFSVPVPALFVAPNPALVHKDKIVSAADAQAVFAYFSKGAMIGNPFYEQDLDGDGAKDGLQYDRSFDGPGRTGPPDGIISAVDAQLAFAQFSAARKC
ncbi:MAG: carboxypeptidase regulatory-like domain-containing protein, partial [Dehalococcoidia bacterium]